MPEHKSIPVKGYLDQSDEKIALVNQNKELEERVLRVIDALMREEDSEKSWSAFDPCWLMEGRREIQKGFMSINRAIFQPGRVSLPEDQTGDDNVG